MLTNINIGYGGQPSSRGIHQDQHNVNHVYHHSDSTNTQPKKKPVMTFKELYNELEKLKPTLEPKIQTFEDLKKKNNTIDKAILQQRREQLKRDRVSDFLGQILINTTAHFDQISTSVSSEGVTTQISGHLSVFKKSAASIYAERAAEFERNAEVEM